MGLKFEVKDACQMLNLTPFLFYFPLFALFTVFRVILS